MTSDNVFSANIMALPLVNAFGAGLAILIWGSVQITVGWATARFGMFGLKEQIPNNELMNYIGVALTLGRQVNFASTPYLNSNNCLRL